MTTFHYLSKLAIFLAILISLSQGAAGQTAADVPHLIEELSAGDLKRAVPAAQKLARIGPDAKPATEALSQALSSDHVELRIAAAKALQAIGPGAEAAIPALIKILDDRGVDQRMPEHEVRVYGGDALAAIGPVSVPQLLEAMDPKNATAYQAICMALHKLGPAAEEAVPRLIELVEKNDDHVIPAVFALQGIGPKSKDAVPALIKTLDHPNFHAQYFACRALGAIGSDAQPAVEKLIERTKNGVTSVRRNAAAALGQIGPAGGEVALQALVEALDDPLHLVRIEAIVGLGRWGPAAAVAIPKLKEFLADERFVGKSQVAGALWRIDANEQDTAMQALMSELQAENAPWDAARELGELAPRANRVADIAQLLDNEQEETREFAAEALGHMGAAAASYLERLEAMANDDKQSADVRTAAREAIVRITSQPKPASQP